jgi:hypothetical protein
MREAQSRCCDVLRLGHPSQIKYGVKSRSDRARGVVKLI